MVCPFCGSERPRVAKVNPDGKRDPRRTYRRRYCLACGRRWRTVEIIDLNSPNNGGRVGDPWRNRAAARNGRGDHPPARPLGPPPNTYEKTEPAEYTDEPAEPMGPRNCPRELKATVPLSLEQIAAELRADPLG